MSNRREFLRLSGKSLAAGLMFSRSLAWPEAPVKPKAIVFDAFPIFDPRPVSALVEEVFPGKGAELSAAWRTRQFEYTWLRNSMGDYKDFWQVTQDALVFAANSLKLESNSRKTRSPDERLSSTPRLARRA